MYFCLHLSSPPPWPCKNTTYLQQPPNCYCQELSIRAESCCCHWTLEAEVVQQHTPHARYQQRTTSLVYRQQQLAIRTQAQCADL
jgi:hypothetical protein